MRAALKKIIILRNAIYVRCPIEFYENVSRIELAKSSFCTLGVAFIIALYGYERFIVPTYHLCRVLLLQGKNCACYKYR